MSATLAFKKTAKTQAPEREFNPPAVVVGDIVHFYHGRPPEDADEGDMIGGREPTAAIVAKLLNAPGMLSLSIIEPDSYTIRTLDEGVRHVDDPRLAHDLSVDGERGFWTLKPAKTLAEAFTPAEIAGLRELLYLSTPQNKVAA